MGIFFKKISTRRDYSWEPYRIFLKVIGYGCGSVFKGFCDFIHHFGVTQHLNDREMAALIYFFRDEAGFFNPTLHKLPLKHAVNGDVHTACPHLVIPFFAEQLVLPDWINFAKAFRRRGWKINMEPVLAKFFVPLVMKYCDEKLCGPAVFYESWRW